MARGLLRDTENNQDDWEILLQFLSAVYCEHFPIVLKDFSIVYYITIAPYNSKSISRYYVCLIKHAHIGVFLKGTKFFHQVYSLLRLWFIHAWY